MAPTNLLRNSDRPPQADAGRLTRPRRAAKREVLIRAGSVVIRARLLDTPTADRVWATLPIYSTAETWGEAVHFETHVETGREAGARWSIRPGDIAFWVEDHRIVIGFGPTPLSRPGEIRLPAPCNVWATALDDVRALAAVRPGEQVSVLVADS